MSSFLADTPFMRLAVENHLTRKRYPKEGFIQGVVDTGYDGFLAVPEDAFRSLGLDALQGTTRRVSTADSRSVEMKSSPGSAEVEGWEGTFDGMIESAAGVEEVLVGTWFLSRFRVTLDYCAGVCKIERCR